jgi:plastocyanin
VTRGEERAHRDDRAGSFPYHCSFHPGMVASLTVKP